MNIQDVVRGLIQKDSGQAREIFAKASQQTRDIFHSVAAPHIQPIQTGVSLLDNAIGKGLKNPSTQSIVQNFMKQASPSLIQKADDMAAKLDPKKGLDLNRVKRQVLESPKVSPQTKGMVSRLRMGDREVKEKKPLQQIAPVPGASNVTDDGSLRGMQTGFPWGQHGISAAESKANIRRTLGGWGDFIVSTADEVYQSFEREAKKKEDQMKAREQSKADYRDAILKFKKGDGPLPKWEDYSDSLLKPTIGELTAPMRERAYGGIITDPLFFAGASLQSFGKGEEVWGVANAAIAAGTIHPIGWLVTGAFNQKGVRDKVETLTVKWTERGDQLKQLPVFKQVAGIHPEVEDAMDVAWQFIPYVLGAKVLRRAVKKPVPGLKVTEQGTIKTDTFWKDRAWWDALTEEADTFLEAVSKDPEAALKDVLSNMDEIRDAKAMALSIEAEPLIAEFRGDSRKPELEELKGKTFDAETFDVDAYVDAWVTAREAARKGDAPSGVPSFLRDFYFDAKEKLVDSNSSWEDFIRHTTKKHKLTILPEAEMGPLIDRVYRAPSMAIDFMQQNGLDSTIVEVARMGSNSLEAFGKYLIDRHAPLFEKINGKGSSGIDLELAALNVERLNPMFDRFAQRIYKYNQALIDSFADNGMISRETAEFYKREYPEYVPFNRIFSEMEQQKGSVSAGGAVGNVGGQNVIRKAAGSLREIEHPIASIIQRTMDMSVVKAKNEVAQAIFSYSKLPGFSEIIKPLRTAEQVKKRIDLFSEAKDLKGVQDQIQGFIRRHRKDFRKFVSEINKLQKEGETTATRLVNQMVSADTLRKWEKGKKTLPSNALDFTKDQRVQDVINDLMNNPPHRLRQLAQMIERRQNIAGELADELVGLQEAYQSVKEKRIDLVEQGRLLADTQKASDKGTISGFRDGIKEVYEVPRWLEDAMKNMTPQQFSGLGKAVSNAVRFFKSGTTVFNPVFIARNLPRDVQTAIVNAIKGSVTEGVKQPSVGKIVGNSVYSVIDPYIMSESIVSALGKGELYKQVVSEAGLTNRFDTGREAARRTLDSVAASASLTSKVKHMIKNPMDLVRTLEDVASIPEIGVRLKVYDASFHAFKKMGMNDQRARIKAASEARNVTGNFLRRGAWGQVLNMWFPYLNASIQGGRSFIRALERDPVNTMMKWSTTVAFPLAATTLWNLSSKERMAAYMDFQEYEFENSFILLPEHPTKDEDGNWESYKIPMPQGMSSLAQPIRKVIEEIYAADELEAYDMFAYLFGTFSPIDIQSSNALAATATPQLVRGGVEVIVNQKFFTGAPVVPDNAKTRLEMEADTTQAAKMLAKITGLSPLETEHLLNSYMGSSAESYFNLTDHALAAIGFIEPEEVGGQSFGEALKRSFRQTRGGRLDDKQFDIIGSMLDEQDIARAQASMAADDVVEAMLASGSKKEELEILKAALAKNPDLEDKIEDNLKDRALGLTKPERYAKALNVTNLARAKYIHFFLLEGMTDEERFAKLTELQFKGVASDTVVKQVLQLQLLELQDPGFIQSLKPVVEEN